MPHTVVLPDISIALIIFSAQVNTTAAVSGVAAEFVGGELTFNFQPRFLSPLKKERHA